METIEKTIEVFLAEIKASVSGAQVKFKIDYAKNKVIVISAPSAFVKTLTNLEGALVHLGSDGLTFQLFKR